MPLLNVRLDAEDKRLADQLREEGIPISRIVREAIRSEHARRIATRGRKQKPSELVADLFEQFPDAPRAKGHGIDTTDRQAVQAYIAARLRRKSK
jgi:post-segregation antitoxin (ccd killing protein)